MSYLGWLQQRELAEAYAISDLLLFPSEVETFGNVTLEAMASGLACIVDERCSAHLVQDGKNGYTVRGGDVDVYHRFARRLCHGAEGAALRKRLGDEGRRTLAPPRLRPPAARWPTPLAPCPPARPRFRVRAQDAPSRNTT